uniref:Cytochrome c oxidase subunit 2 n=1 Tax=Metopiellus crypticus TaxID=3140185 RepID=A0AAT9QFV1_9COLE|nr:cytochrome c oxidase subunit 2 [Metopiellus sp.]UUK33559.1 cytochrome c oxidase subunit 2 [Metopiellus sp.]UUK33572.1 cytochrome c oxidase subunit 2 [Metopiellus sp.]
MTWNTLNFQNSISPLMEQLIFFHDHSMTLLLMILLMILYIIIILFKNKYNFRFLINNQMIELIWTILPIIILILIALPSLNLLYLFDEMNNPLITIKVIGHQWYWSYEYSDFKNIEFDSYMIYNQIDNYNFRLLDVDNHLIIPFNIQIRIIITSMDVIHSWTIPSMNIKVDAIPGRLNQTNFFINNTGIYFGQCSEICGMNHSFMPIVIESVSKTYFIKWIILTSNN